MNAYIMKLKGLSDNFAYEQQILSAINKVYPNEKNKVVIDESSGYSVLEFETEMEFPSFYKANEALQMIITVISIYLKIEVQKFEINLV